MLMRATSFPYLNMSSPAPDSQEKLIRFGCGFLAGGVFGFFVLLSFVAAFSLAFWGGVILSGLVFAFLAMRFGDSAWHGLLRLLSGFWS
jgi:hypothetical protein